MGLSDEKWEREVFGVIALCCIAIAVENEMSGRLFRLIRVGWCDRMLASRHDAVSPVSVDKCCLLLDRAYCVEVAMWAEEERSFHTQA